MRNVFMHNASALLHLTLVPNASNMKHLQIEDLSSRKLQYLVSTFFVPDENGGEVDCERSKINEALESNPFFAVNNKFECDYCENIVKLFYNRGNSTAKESMNFTVGQQNIRLESSR